MAPQASTGRNVLAFPAKRVADAVNKIEKALLIFSHSVSRPKPDVALGEYVPDDLLLVAASSV